MCTDICNYFFFPISDLYSDETIISLFGHNDKQYVRRPKGKAYHPKYTKPTTKHSQQIAVWGCFSKGQIISEQNCGVLNFPKKQQNYCKDICPT
jgi:hypothetical protein